jgi:hypothetical protein
MNERQKRLIEVYEHLRRYYGIHTKTGFAEALHYGRTSMSAAMNGDEKYLTDSLFKNICETYKGVFNLDYLLTGKGSLLADTEEKQSTPTAQQPAADLLELYAQRIRLVDDLRVTLQSELNEVRSLKSELKNSITDLHKAIAELHSLVKQSNRPYGMVAENI